MCLLLVWKGRVSAIIPRATDPVFVAWVRTPATFHRDCLERLLFLVLQAYTSAEVSRCCARHCFLALCLMVIRQRRQVSLTLTDRSAKTCGAISSVWLLSSVPALARETHQRRFPLAPLTTHHVVTALQKGPVVWSSPLVVIPVTLPCVLYSSCIRALISSLHSSRIRAMLLPWTCGSALHALENHQVHTLLAKMMTKIIPLECSPGNFQLKKLPVTMFFPELVIGNSENSKLFACLAIDDLAWM